MKLKRINGKLYARIGEPAERTSPGICRYCKEPVYVSEGQAYSFLKRKDKYTGEIYNEVAHKKCRKINQ